MLNQVTLIGRVGADPEVRTVNGDTVCKFTLATSTKWRDKQSNEPMERTEWHTVVMWRKQAELAQKYVKKGSVITIVGEIRYSTWEKDGQKHYKTEIFADKMVFMPSGEAKQKPVDSASMPSNNQPEFELPPSEELDGIPF